jgi:hypothetical protein
MPKTGGGPARTLPNPRGRHVAGVIQMGHPARRRYAFSSHATFPLPRRVVFYVCVLARTYLVRSVVLLSGATYPLNSRRMIATAAITATNATTTTTARSCSMARKSTFAGKKAAPFRKGGKARKPGTVNRKPRKKAR